MKIKTEKKLNKLILINKLLYEQNTLLDRNNFM